MLFIHSHVFTHAPWHWAVSGFLIGLTMVLLTSLGRSFGVSQGFKTLCEMSGAYRISDFFQEKTKDQWLLVFILGSIIGGTITHLLTPKQYTIPLTQDALQTLRSYGLIEQSALGLFPSGLQTQSVSTALFLLIGGGLVGFGARYAGGCTSGHAITGLSHLQWSSLWTVVGFFLGGLAMVHLFFPAIFQIVSL